MTRVKILLSLNHSNFPNFHLILFSYYVESFICAKNNFLCWQKKNHCTFMWKFSDWPNIVLFEVILHRAGIWRLISYQLVIIMFIFFFLSRNPLFNLFVSLSIWILQRPFNDSIINEVFQHRVSDCGCSYIDHRYISPPTLSVPEELRGDKWDCTLGGWRSLSHGWQVRN